MSDLLTIDEVAAELRVHRATVYAEIGRGRLRVVKVGRLTFVRERELERYKIDRTRAA